ncbi:hypothetical protein ACFYO7_32085 [Nocardia salmonicida]|uniref:hypothetical protein n=1 Tax=Nocardia salmonicida TaxID=53431 RepID=UPI003696E361
MREAIAGMAVGGNAADIMRRFLDGWNRAQSLADIATAMADNAEVAAAIGPVITARSISIATDLYDTYGDLDDILSTTQLDTLERLRLHSDSSDGRPPAIRTLIGGQDAGRPLAYGFDSSIFLPGPSHSRNAGGPELASNELGAFVIG